MKSSVLLIGNPVAGAYAKEKIDKAKRLLISSGARVELFLTKKKGDAQNRAEDALKENLSIILVAGGDGTINEVINGVAMSDRIIGILPLGTTNVLAKEIKIPDNVERALAMLKSGRIHRVSLGRIRSEQTSIKRYFILMAGIGFDGSTVYAVDYKTKRFSGKGAYILSGIKNLISYNPNKLKFSINGSQYDGYNAIIGNAACYGGSFKVTPDASLESPEFSICIFKGNKRHALVKYVLGIITGSHLKFRDIFYLKCKKVTVEGEAHIQIDGDYFGRSPVTIESVNNALNLIY